MPPPGPEVETVPPPAIDVAFVYTWKEALRSSLALRWANAPSSRFVPWVGAALLAAAAYVAWAYASSGGLWAWIPGTCGALFLVTPVFIRWSILRDFRASPGANAAIRWHIDEQKLHARGPFGDATFPWPALRRIVVTRHGYLIFTQPFLAQWLPRAAFASAADREQFERWGEAARAGAGTVFATEAIKPTTVRPARPDRGGGIAAAAGHVEDGGSQGRLTSEHTGAAALLVSFVYTADEAARARDAFRKSIPPLMRYAPWFPAAIAAALMAGLMTYRWDWRLIAALAAFLILVAWRVRVSEQKERADAFSQLPAADRTVRWRIDAARLDVVGAHSDASFPWTALIKVRETQDGFLLFQQPRLAQWLPTTAFASPAELAQFRAWMQHHGVDLRRV